MKQGSYYRETSIDALRGIAIVGMILSGTIAHNADLPAWLFHAQVGPPDFTFHPEIPGITWVDLVFPFFLFAMGLSFPFSLNRQLENGLSKATIIKKVFLRSMKLFMFAVLLGHMSPYRWQGEASFWPWLLALLTFFGFFLTFSRFPYKSVSEKRLNAIGYLSLLIILLVKTLVFNQPFSIHTNDIIILVLANMALFGAIIWLYTANNWWPRIGVLGLYLALRLTAGIPDSLNNQLWNFTLIKGLGNLFPGLADSLQSIGVSTTKTVFYNSNFIKYLFIVLPGSMVGDMLYTAIKNKKRIQFFRESKNLGAWLMVALLLFVVIFAQVALFARWGASVHVLLIILALLILYLTFKLKDNLPDVVLNIIRWSSYWLILGVLFDPYEGGIKKDHATLSYFFVTTGLAGYTLMVFKAVFELKAGFTKWQLMPSIGKNPMVGYVVVSYFVMPLFYFTGISSWMGTWHTLNPWLGLLHGLVLTGLMIWLTRLTVKQRLFWKT